jgi:hypothetical protein
MAQHSNQQVCCQSCITLSAASATQSSRSQLSATKRHVKSCSVLPALREKVDGLVQNAETKVYLHKSIGKSNNLWSCSNLFVLVAPSNSCTSKCLSMSMTARLQRKFKRKDDQIKRLTKKRLSWHEEKQ